MSRPGTWTLSNWRRSRRCGTNKPKHPRRKAQLLLSGAPLAKFETVRRKARFGYVGFGQDAIERIADKTRASVLARIQRGETVSDSPAKPLKARVKAGVDRGYRAQKARKGGQPIRDWTYTGHTLKSMKVLLVSVTKAVIGFLPNAGFGRKLTAAQIASIRNADERQFGLSPRDKDVMMTAVTDEVRSRPPVRPFSEG
jgi:hypothetical protein